MGSNRYTEDQLKEAVKLSFSISETLKRLGMSVTGHNPLRLLYKIKELNIDYSHFCNNPLRAESACRNKTTEELLKKNSVPIVTSNLKKRLLKENLLENKCILCGITEWKGFPISLHLDHINGDPLDNRLENLRMLCPNCHSQTDTYCGRNKKSNIKNQPLEELVDITRVEKQEKIKTVITEKKETTPRKERKKYFCSCGTQINPAAIRCYPCNFNNKHKIVWPSKEELEKLVWEKPATTIAEELGVSDKAIEKKCKRYNISKPTRGYWAIQKGNRNAS